jgi:hypothetical protein
MRQENQHCGLFGRERSTFLVDGAAGSRCHALCVGARRKKFNTEETLHNAPKKRERCSTNETPPIERMSTGHELVARLHLPVQREEQLHLDVRGQCCEQRHRGNAHELTSFFAELTAPAEAAQRRALAVLLEMRHETQDQRSS